MGSIARVPKSGGGTDFNPGHLIDPAEVNADFNSLFNTVNGGLDSDNIESGSLPGDTSFRFTEISEPPSPSSNELLVYAADDGRVEDGNGVTVLKTKDSAGRVANALSWTLAGSDANFEDDERITTSISSVDVSTVALSIPEGDAFVLMFKLRKSAGHASAIQIGLKINGIQVYADFNASSAVNRAEDGFVVSDGPFGAAITNYAHMIPKLEGSVWPSVAGTTVALAVTSGTTIANPMPAGPIFSVTITGHVANVANTLGIRDVKVYRLAGF